MSRRLLLALALLLVPLGASEAALDIEFGRYHALVIGINDYKNLPRLETAVNDASAVADLLRQKYAFEVSLLLNPTRSQVIRALDGLRGKLTERDNLLVYYAGHGVLDVEADAGFWMSVDAEESTQADWISIGTVTQTVKAMSAKHVMVVSDSCYSGTLTRGLVAFDGDTYEVWVIDTRMELSNPGAGNASTIERRFLFSDSLAITFRVDEEVDEHSKSWELLTHGDYVLRRID